MSAFYTYYELKQKLIRSQLGTCPSTDIYHEHLLNKSKKLITQANKQEGKLRKNLQKFLGQEITPQKEIDELKGVIRTYSEILGEKFELPDDLKSLLEMADDINKRVDELINKNEELKATVFMRDPDGNPAISGHLILGNVKEIMRTIVNGGDRMIFKSKVQLNECSALDLKVVEPFLTASEDIMRDSSGERILNVRPIRFDYMGKSTTALSASEEIPIGNIWTSTLRIRKGSPLDSLAVLKKIFSFGRNLGLGAWRSSGNHGAYVFQLKEMPKFEEDFGDWE